MTGRQAALAAAVLAVAAAAYILYSTGGAGGATGTAANAGGLTIVVTFSNLADDVRLLACSDDHVVALVPPGVDPHSYQLTPRDIQEVKKADLVVSTGHAPFEVKLRSIVAPDRLVEIPRIPGIRLLENPVTHKPNYHMPIYDPDNYVAFVKYLADRLSKLRPSCANHYRSAAERVVGEVEALREKAPRLNVAAVGSSPPVQYAVTWLGVRLAWLLVPEAGVAPTPETLSRAESLLRSNDTLAVVMVIDGHYVSPADEKLASMASEAGRKVLRVPAPFAPGSMVDKLRLVAEEAAKLAGSQ